MDTFYFVMRSTYTSDRNCTSFTLIYSSDIILHDMCDLYTNFFHFYGNGNIICYFYLTSSMKYLSNSIDYGLICIG